MIWLIDSLSFLMLTAGGFFVVVGSIGVLRLPDFYTRMHGASVTDTLGAGLILAGLMLQGGFSLITLKLVMVLVLIVVTSPTATHALAKAALHGALAPQLAHADEVHEIEPSKL